MIEWPGGNRCALVLTFDMDAELNWLNFCKRKGFEKPSARLVGQGIYGPRVAVPKILTLLDKYKIKACFFIPGKAAELHPAAVKAIADHGQEIGHHGFNHIDQSKLSYAEEEAEFQKGVDIIKTTGGVVPRGFRLPGGDMSDNTLTFIKKFNFLYDSSMSDDDVPYMLERGAKPVVELPNTAGLDDWIYYVYNLLPPLEYQSGPHNPSEYFEAMVSALDASYKEGGYVNVMMHPQVEGRPARLAALERFIKYAKRKGKVWITTPISLAEFWIKHEK